MLMARFENSFLAKPDTPCCKGCLNEQECTKSCRSWPCDHCKQRYQRVYAGKWLMVDSTCRREIISQQYADAGTDSLTCAPARSMKHLVLAHTFWVYGPSHQIDGGRQAPLRSSDGTTLLTDKEAIMQCWSEHFESLFSDKRTVLAKIPQVEVKLDLDDRPTHS